MSNPAHGDLAELLELIVHDLRNPAATLAANLSYVKDVTGGGTDDADLPDAIADMGSALADLRGGLDHLAWIARWLHGRPAMSISDGDAAIAAEKAAARSDLTDVQLEVNRPLRARGGGTLARVLDLLLANSRLHARGGPVRLRAFREGAHVVVEVHDGGPAIAPELRDLAFAIEGQTRIKARPEGRYGSVAALLAARALTDTMGATIAAGGENGAAWFRLRLAAL
jgi:signal transduction histidine kinase